MDVLPATAEGAEKQYPVKYLISSKVVSEDIATWKPYLEVAKHFIRSRPPLLEDSALDAVVEAHILFASKIKNFTKTKIQKIFFLAEILHYHEHGRPAFGLHFISYIHGPFAYGLFPFDYRIVEKIKQNSNRVSLFSHGDHYAGLNGVPNADVKLAPDIRQTCEKVIEKYGELHLDSILMEVYSLVIYQMTSFGAALKLEGWSQGIVVEHLSDGIDVGNSFQKFIEVAKNYPSVPGEKDLSAPVLPAQMHIDELVSF